MATVEESRHDILLIIITALVILFATGLVEPVPTPRRSPIVIP